MHGVSDPCREQPNVALDACAGSSERRMGWRARAGAGRRTETCWDFQ